MNLDILHGWQGFMIVLLEMKRNTIPSKHLFEIILKTGNPILKNKSISLLIHFTTSEIITKKNSGKFRNFLFSQLLV